jgi:DNA-binding response OmpR family regulator
MQTVKSKGLWLKMTCHLAMSSKTISQSGYDDTMSDGQAAIDKFSKDQFDIYLLGYYDAQQDGFLSKIRQQSDIIPFFLTAKSLEEDKIRVSKQAQMIVKPFSMQNY